jgi:hypothetical protein
MRIISLALGLFLSLVVSNLIAAVITVDVTTDGTGTGAQCELRDAIEAANNNLAVDGCVSGSIGADAIVFSIVDTSIKLNSDLPTIIQTLSIIGPGKDRLTISGANAYKIFTALPTTSNFTLRGLALSTGLNASNGGCVGVSISFDILIEDVSFSSCESTGSGGGAGLNSVNSGTITVRRTSFISNTSTFGGGGLQLSSGSVNNLIEDSVFYNNNITNSLSGGGALLMGGPFLTVRRSTFVGNVAVRAGSAINTLTLGSTLLLQHSTVARNNLIGIGETFPGGAVIVTGNLQLFNTVIANNLELNSFHNVSDIALETTGSVTTLGYNFIGNNETVSASFPAGTNANGDQVGTAGAQLDADLGGLQDNGGPTISSLPNANSPLVDQGSCPGQLRDQRGYLNNATGERAVDVLGISDADDGCDIGAVEYMATQSEVTFRDGFESL